MLARFVHRSSLSTLHVWTWLSFLSLVLCISSVEAQQAGLQNVTIVNTSPEITFTPFFCNSTTDCTSGWRVLDVDGFTAVSTDGPAADGVDIVPQMFFRFRATRLSMTTSILSNASMNLTVLSGSTVLNAVANSSVGLFSILNLQDTQTTTLSITYIQSPIPSRLDIGNITITVSDGSASSSFLPTQTLPPSIALPSVTPTSTSIPPSIPDNSAKDARKNLIADAVGLTLGLGFGLTAITCAIYILWRRRRRKRREASSEQDFHGGNLDNLESAARPRTWSYRLARLARNKDNMDTRWFNF
ncbi:hypothetical protein E1B28_007870 [Marasmius oreades]|uniref:Mid2 domain-containing protein n=1 Tax=Marasmius oreades TaxID=181124 RepID=A0A9P7S3X6_9AGAR|nr:uncharacterized protein E1B28_007870 [Marasmius oreades]KAG7094266.1 hypothetical protein E1B28_007870 [Marasmius oreades]